MCDADPNYREQAQLFIEAADTALDQRVRATLLGLATSALRIAGELEAGQRQEDQVSESKLTARHRTTRLGSGAST